MQRTVILLIIAVCIGYASPTSAHDPGLSKAVLELRASVITLRAAFSEQDIDAIFRMDTDYDGRVSADEFATAKSELRTISVSAMELESENIPIAAESVHVRLADSGSIEIELRFQAPAGSTLRSTFPIISLLPRGHRQYLSVHDARGQLLGQHILDATSSPLDLGVPETSRIAVFLDFLKEGVWHIWMGFDHVLFLLTLLLPAVLLYRYKRWHAVENLRPALIDVLKIVTAFTVAHSITLALAILEIIELPSILVETVIAFSVLVTAVNNLRPVFPESRWLLGFAFGLIHGFGFANVLVELELPRSALALALFGFNIGVEAGQLAIVSLVFPLAFIARHTSLYRTWVFRGGSIAAAVTAGVWMFQRVA